MAESLRKRKLTEEAGHLPTVDQNLVRVGGELNVETLLEAYRGGAFPWTVRPVTWWSPDPRTIIEFSEFHTPRSLGKVIRQGKFSITIDRDFAGVMAGCAESAPNRRTTWITPEFIRAYTELHGMGHAHSLEVWQEGRLAGGIYGVSIGGYFAGESMFHRVSNASKVALHGLMRHLQARGYAFLDVQMPTRITVQMGARVVPRDDFLRRLRAAQERPAMFGAELAGEGFAPVKGVVYLPAHEINDQRS